MLAKSVWAATGDRKRDGGWLLDTSGSQVGKLVDITAGGTPDCACYAEEPGTEGSH